MTLVRTKARGPSIERSTWDSAAKKDRLGQVAREDRGQARGVGDVGLFEHIARRLRDIGQAGQVAGIGQSVQVDDAMARGQRRSHQGRTDEAGAAIIRTFTSWPLSRREYGRRASGA